MTDQQRPPIWNLNKLTLWNPPKEGRKSARLSWALIGGSPRATVFVPTEAGTSEMMGISLEPSMFFMFLDMLETVAKSDKEIKQKIEAHGKDQNTGENRLQSSLWFGKSDKGLVWISVVVEGKPKETFNFRIPDWNKIFTSTGERLDESKISVLHCLKTIEVLKLVFANLMSAAMIADNPNKEGGGNSDSNKETDGFKLPY